jgi:hypothetical protein
MSANATWDESAGALRVKEELDLRQEVEMGAALSAHEDEVRLLDGE